MDLSGVYLATTANNIAPNNNVEKLYTELRSTQFQDCMNDLQMNADIMKHLKGVPFEAVYIAPNILEKMKNNPSTYDYYMKKLDGFVGEYKKYHRLGVLEMSFSISEDGQYCTSADPAYLDSMYEDSDDVDTVQKNTLKFLKERFGIELPSQMDTGILASFAGANFINRERIKFFNSVE